MDNRLSELNNKLTEVKNVEKSVITQTAWIDKVNDVWSPSQMKEAKDEIYKQKNREREKEVRPPPPARLAPLPLIKGG